MARKHDKLMAAREQRERERERERERRQTRGRGKYLSKAGLLPIVTNFL
jgi:hypothetical protein